MKYQYLDRPGVVSDDHTSSWSEDDAASLLLADWSPTPSRRKDSRDWTEADLKTLPIPHAVLRLVPESVASEHNVLPLADDGETLTIACVDETNIALADKLRFVLARDIYLVRARRTDIAEAINRHYGHLQTESVDSMLMEFTETAIDFDEADLSGDARSRLNKTLSSRRGGTPQPATTMRRERHRPRATRVLYNTGPLPEQERHSPMLVYTVEEGDRVLMTRRDGSKQLVIGPKRVWGWFNCFQKLRHTVAHPGQFLIVRSRNGSQRHLPGPAEIWFDPREHEEITCEECLQISSKEAVVVYSRDESEGTVTITRRILYGPALFVPQPGEWLHTFSWHASKGGHLGVEKLPNGLVFQKLWLMPDQMYHDVRDVRTADNAVLTIRLMVFFELSDIDRMLDATHDPIGDFVNATTADVVEFTGRHDFESFKKNTDQLNDLATYKTLQDRAQQIGYRINNVVYRGYGAADSLQKMHDQAIEARTRLQLDRATEEQTQELENFRLQSQLERASTRRSEQTQEVRHDIELSREKQEAELRRHQARQENFRTQREADARLQQEITIRDQEQLRAHLEALRGMQVDLTAYLTQSRADQVIEFRGNGTAPHVHVDSHRFSSPASQKHSDGTPEHVEA